MIGQKTNGPIFKIKPPTGVFNALQVLVQWGDT